MEGETQPRSLSVQLGHPAGVQEAFCHPRASLPKEGSFAENQSCLRLPFPIQLGRLQALAALPRGSWLGETLRVPCAALRPGAGWAPGHPSPWPTQPFNGSQEPVGEAAYPPGNRDSPAWQSPPCTRQPG